MRVIGDAEVSRIYQSAKCLIGLLSKQETVERIVQFVEIKMSPNMAAFLGLEEERVEDKEAWLSYRMGYGDWPGREVSHVEAELLAGVLPPVHDRGVIRGRSFRNPLPKFCFRFTTTLSSLTSPPPLSRHCRPVLELHWHRTASHQVSRPPSPPLRLCSEQPRLSPGPCLRLPLRLRLRYPHPSLVCKTCTSTSTHPSTLPHAARLAHDRVFFGTTNISTAPTHACAFYFHLLAGS